MVNQRHARFVHDAPAGGTYPEAEIDVFEEQEEPLVESIDAVKRIATHQQSGSRNPWHAPPARQPPVNDPGNQSVPAVQPELDPAPQQFAK
jgi:hypothetical protein